MKKPDLLTWVNSRRYANIKNDFGRSDGRTMLELSLYKHPCAAWVELHWYKLEFVKGGYRPQVAKWLWALRKRLRQELAKSKQNESV